MAHLVIHPASNSVYPVVVSGEADKAQTVAAAFERLAPAFNLRLAHLGGRVARLVIRATNRRAMQEGGAAGVRFARSRHSGSDLLALHLAPNFDRPGVNHAFAHELAHVLCAGLLENGESSAGPTGEYAAEHLAWEMLLEVNALPNQEAEVRQMADGNFIWLRWLVNHVKRIEAGTFSPRARWTLGQAPKLVVSARAYDLGREHAGVLAPVSEQALPAVFAEAIEAVVGPLKDSPLPDHASAEQLSLFLNKTGALVWENYRLFSSNLVPLVLNNWDELQQFVQQAGPKT
jgi:hypothetical protein